MTAVSLQTVVIGSGRSGTAWAARHLTALGTPCGHESVFDWHPSSRADRRLDYEGRTPSPFEPPPDVELAADSSLAAIAYLSQLPTSCRVWHVVRDPLAVIASWVGRGVFDDAAPSTPYARFVAAHVPECFAEITPVGRAARWVSEWNLRGRRAALNLGLPYRLSRIEPLSKLGDAVNVSTHEGLSWADTSTSMSAETRAMLDVWRHVAGYVR